MLNVAIALVNQTAQLWPWLVLVMLGLSFLLVVRYFMFTMAQQVFDSLY